MCVSSEPEVVLLVVVHPDPLGPHEVHLGLGEDAVHATREDHLVADLLVAEEGAGAGSCIYIRFDYLLMQQLYSAN